MRGMALLVGHRWRHRGGSRKHAATRMQEAICHGRAKPFIPPPSVSTVYGDIGGAGHVAGIPVRVPRESRLSGSINDSGEVLFRNLRGDAAVIVSHLRHIALEPSASPWRTSAGEPAAPQRLPLAPERVIVNWEQDVRLGLEKEIAAKGYPGPPSSLLSRVFQVEGFCSVDYRAVLRDKYLSLAEQVNRMSPSKTSYKGRLPRLALLHAPNSPLSPEIRRLFVSIAARQGARMFNYITKNPDNPRQPVIDRFQIQIYSQRWPADFRNNIDMVLQPVNLGAGEVTFDQLTASFKWLLGSEPRSAGDAHLMGIFSDPSTEVRDLHLGKSGVAAAGKGKGSGC